MPVRCRKRRIHRCRVLPALIFTVAAVQHGASGSPGGSAASRHLAVRVHLFQLPLQAVNSFNFQLTCLPGFGVTCKDSVTDRICSLCSLAFVRNDSVKWITETVEQREMR